jgi:replicative DNA helicase
MYFNEKKLTLISSRPCMGKTSFATQLSISLIKTNTVLYISKESVINNFISNLSNTPLSEIKTIENNSKSNCKIHIIKQWIKQQNLFFIENYPIYQKDSINYIQKKIIETNSKKIFIDGVSLRYFKDNNLGIEDYINLMQYLKIISRNLNIQIFVTHELDQFIEELDNKKPNLSSLENEKYLYEIVDDFLFLYRDDYYISNHIKKHTRILEVFYYISNYNLSKTYFYKINKNFNRFSLNNFF